jgi:hypothetical protein
MVKRAKPVMPSRAQRVGKVISSNVRGSFRHVGNGAGSAGEVVADAAKGVWSTVKDFGSGLKKGWERG